MCSSVCGRGSEAGIPARAVSPQARGCQGEPCRDRPSGASCVPPGPRLPLGASSCSRAPTSRRLVPPKAQSGAGGAGPHTHLCWEEGPDIWPCPCPPPRCPLCWPQLAVCCGRRAGRTPMGSGEGRLGRGRRRWWGVEEPFQATGLSQASRGGELGVAGRGRSEGPRCHSSGRGGCGRLPAWEPCPGRQDWLTRARAQATPCV